MRMPVSIGFVVAIAALTMLGLAAPARGDVPGLEVSVSTQPARVHAYAWTIDDTAEQAELFLSTGEQGVVNHTVTCDATFTDGDYHVTGEITITNNTGAVVTITGVSVVVMPDIAGTVDCGVAFPYDLAAGATLTCDYIAQLPCTMTRNVWATVTTTAGEQQGMGVSDFTYGVVEEVDERIDLDDSLAGYLGFCLASEAPVQFQYGVAVGPFADPGDWQVVNTISFTTNDTLTMGSDECSVLVHVTQSEDEGNGCTFSAGYWKTHSEFGPAPYDCTWTALPSGACTPFFLSDQTYYEVLWTPPRGGNAYYILAHQYIAAGLNMASGASASDEVCDTFDAATELLETCTPEQIGVLRGGDATRKLFLCLAGTLGRYNEADSGGDECDGEADSVAPPHRHRVAASIGARDIGARRARH